MSAKKRKKPSQPKKTAVETATPLPKFEIGRKGDEFDVKYTRAASASRTRADALLRSLSKETREAGYNLISFAVLALLIIVLAMSFAFLSRSGDAPQLRLKSLADGSYTADLSEYYTETLPFGRGLKTLWAFFGFTDMPEPAAPEITDPDDPSTEPFEPDEPPVTIEPAVTTVPTTTETPTSAPLTEPTETTPVETRIMFARDTLNIRLSPSTDSMIMGYFGINEEVEVVELRSDGWAEILYNGLTAYVSSDYLGEETVATTKATRRTNTEDQTEEPSDTTSEEVTTAPEETEPLTDVPEAETEETTTKRTVDGELSKFLERQSILESKRQATATEPPQPDPETPPEPVTEP